jgi:cell division protein ZapD
MSAISTTIKQPDGQQGTISTANLIIFEQPMNETLRICLRLEKLFTTVRENFHEENDVNMRDCIRSMLQIMELTSRPDLKSKLIKCISQYKNNLNNISFLDATEKLDIETRLKNYMTQLLGSSQRIGEKLRKNEFLNSARLICATPGGDAEFNVPSFSLWLKSDIKQRQDQLALWMHEFTHLESLCHILLALTRRSECRLEINCENGFYQQLLDTNEYYQMLSIALPLNINVYPEVSIGKHRLCIRFVKTDFSNNGHATQVYDTFKFNLGLCKTVKY